MAGSRASTLLMGTITVLSLSLAAYMGVRAQQPSPAPAVTASATLSALDHVEISPRVRPDVQPNREHRGMTIVSEVEERRA